MCMWMRTWPWPWPWPWTCTAMCVRAGAGGRARWLARARRLHPSRTSVGSTAANGQGAPSPARPAQDRPAEAKPPACPAQSCVVWVRQRQSPVAVVASSTCVSFATFNHPDSLQPHRALRKFHLGSRFLFVICLHCFCRLAPLIANVPRPYPGRGGCCCCCCCCYCCCVHAPVVTWKQCLSVSLPLPPRPSLLLRWVHGPAWS
jgi:hypothetical protein